MDLKSLKEKLSKYEKDLAEHNARWEIEKLSPAVRASGDQLDKDGHAIIQEVADLTGQLIGQLNEIGIQLKGIDVVREYATPYHSIWVKAGSIRASKHIVVKGYDYSK
jgi:hypothetical protein